MKVSVLLRVHGNQPHLLEAIESVLSQDATFSFNLWLILDRPSDETLNTISKIVDKKVNLFKPEGQGYSEPLMELLETLEVEYIAILDADDVMNPSRLQLQAQFLDQNKYISVVGSSIIIINENGDEIGRKSYDSNSRILFENRFKKLPVAHPATMYRRIDVIKAGSYRQFYDFAEDYDLWLRVMEFSSIANLPEFLTKYRVHENQTNNRNIESNVLAGVLSRKSGKRRVRGKPDLSQIYSSPRELLKKPTVLIEVRWRTTERILWRRATRSSKRLADPRFYLAVISLVLISPKSVLKKLIYR